ncbi:nucleoprotein TPR isoform X2 [Cylas formicarius]|uniref:nucleoprotein TPR isoform X2 n=1 Tax=Cylas formicarius TaxID=197179 RepID=UPI002958AC86|nr:nucleoprotein TPR isoform X2 [Cylas formicarius]
METYIFASVVSEEEWSSIPEEIGKKISNFVNEKFEEFITSKALLETRSLNSEKTHSDLKEQNEVLQSEKEALNARLQAASTSISELELQVSNLSSELIKLQSRSNKLEAETAEYRHQRNLAIDEREEQLRLVQRRTEEIERMQLDTNSLTKQLEDAINAKCEALAQVNELASMKATVEYKEKRFEQDRQLLDNQIESLRAELHQRTDELLNMRRDNSSRCVQLETKLTEKIQELVVAQDQIKTLTELNDSLKTRNEELAQKIFNEREKTSKLSESYMSEIEANTKMANAYKTMYEQSQQHAKGLQDALAEVQDLLKQATEEYGKLETQHKETTLANEEIISKKNDYIAMLKKELETANEIIERSKQDLIGKDIEGLSSPATSASRIVKSGMTYTELYSRYVSLSDQVTVKDEECTRLNNYITCIVREIEEKGPYIKKLRQEYSDALDSIDMLKASNDQLEVELQQLREATMENKRQENQVIRENERMKKEISDLSRQVIHLLQEVEHSRVGSSSTSDNDLSDSVSSADIISKRLVTFNDIAELQATNQKLLALVRELSERQEEVESFDPAAIANLQRKLGEMRESQNELLEEKEQQTKMMATLRNQRDMYKNLYTQAMKGATDIPSHLERNFSLLDNGEGKMQTDSESTPNYDDKLHDLQAKIDKYKKQIDQIKEEYETYRKEKSDHEKILVEQIDSMRGEIKELTRTNCQITAHAEMNEEKFRVLNNNSEIYKKQITALEKQNRIYSESLIKHEQAASYLKDETIQSQTKLSKAEVMLSHLQKENALLKDAETRLTKEVEMLKRHSHEHSLLHTNLELIKATIERTDAESKLKLEAKLDQAHLECSAIRRRLEEEQTHFRELSEHLEKKVKQAEDRMEEEKKEADRLRKQVSELREELIDKTSHVEDLSKKLKSSVFTIPDSSSECRRNRELEQQLIDAEAEINTLKTKLKTTKDASEEYFNVAQAAEKQLKEVLDQEKTLKDEIDKQQTTIRELQEKIEELQGELSIQMDDQDMANANIKTKSHQLQEELNVRTMDLRTARSELENARSEIKSLLEQLKAVENKYAREVTLHSVDLQSLTDSKEELNQTQNQIRQLESDRQKALDELNENRLSFDEQQKILTEEREKLKQRFKDMEDQNGLLLDQIQALNNQLTILQAQTSADVHNVSAGDGSFNRSFAEDELKSSDQLLKVIKYLRQEKDIAVSKADIIEAEHFRLKAQFETVSKQLEEAQTQIEVERQKTEVSVVSAAKHSKVLRKLETLNAITDSNRALRQERDSLLSEITELRERTEKLETETAPLQERNRDLMTKADQMQSENISLRAECTRWRQRANQLIERTNRTSPEDWKKLQTERETLAKQLTIERSNNVKLNDENNTLKQDKIKLEEQLKVLRDKNNNQMEEISKLRSEVSTLQNQVSELTQQVEMQTQTHNELTEKYKILMEDSVSKEITIQELKNNLAQVKKIAKKYKNQYETQVKDIESLKQQNEQKESEQNTNAEKQNQLMEQQRSEHEERISQLETTHREAVEQLNQQAVSSQEQVDNLKKEIETLKQTNQEKDEKFKTLFKNAKDRIVSLTEQNNNLREELTKHDKAGTSTEQSENDRCRINELLGKIASLEREKEDIMETMQQDKEKHTLEIESLNQRINQLQRQLGQQQGSKPSTSSASSDKTSTERPTADIKPMAGHSTNTQTQSIPIQPWRSGGEPPLASIRPMSQQLRTAAVLPTTQTPSAVMVPPQQQVHTTGSGSVEALSSSPTSSHTDYVPATSSASSTMLGPRQVAVPPTQSSQDTEDDDSNIQIQAAPQQQAVALVSPRVENPSSGCGLTQEQGTSSSSSNTVTTTQAGLKRQRDSDTDSSQAEEQSKMQQQNKRTRMQQAGTVSDSGLEVEYQVPTSSQRDHDDDNVIVVESDDEGGADEGEGADDDQDDPDDTEGYDMEVMEQDNYEDADCQEVEDEEEGGNEVEVIEDSSEVPNRSENLQGENSEQQAQSEAISSGTDGSSGRVTISQASTSAFTTTPPHSRSRLVAPLPYRQLGSILDDAGLDDGIVPSTPTLFVPRRSDGFGEAISSPHVPSSAPGRFTFNESPLVAGPSGGAASEAVPEQTLEVNQPDDNSTGRSVPTTPLQSSPQESITGGSEDAERAGASTQSDAETPGALINADTDDENRGEGSSEECMGPPPQAGPSSDSAQQTEKVDENEAEDGVSSEGEKPPSTEEGEEEGREAEASPSTNSKSRMRGAGPSARRSTRLSLPTRGHRSGPVHLVWENQRASPSRQQERNRGAPQYSRSVARRTRGRIQRPFNGRY